MMLACLFESLDQKRDYYAFAEELIHGAIDHIEAVDEEINAHAANWTFERIAKVDLSVLRLAIYEPSNDATFRPL